MTRFSLRKNNIGDSLVSALSPAAHQRKPFFPDLLRQPDILIVPKPGKMVLVFMYSSSTTIGWHKALAWVEDLIEVKLNVGDYAIVTALVLAEFDEIVINQDVNRLLSSVFEGFLVPSEWKMAFFEHTLYGKLAGLERKSTLDEFLRLEREQVSRALERFSKERYSGLVEKNREPEFQPKQLQSEIRERFSEFSSVQLSPRYPVPNIKGYLGNLGKQYVFEFDFGVIGHKQVVIDIVRVERHATRERMRYLMAKARMLRYRVDDDRLWARAPDFHPILVVDGNLSGPSHDPYRYVRALLSVGWEIIGANHLDRVVEVVRRGHF